jgi:hypothetical protein
MYVDGGPNPLFRLIRPEPGPASPEEAVAMAKVLAFPAKALLSSGGDLAAKGVERALTPILKKTPGWLLDALALAIGMYSLPAIILGIQYGYITSIWRFLSSLIAHFL